MSIWQKHPNYSPEELRLLVEVTSETLLDTTIDINLVPPDLLHLSSRAAAREVATELQDLVPHADSRKIEDLLNDDKAGEELCLTVLDELRKDASLAQSIAIAYEKKTRQMIGIGEMLTAALVLLAMKLQTVEIVNEKGKLGSQKRA